MPPPEPAAALVRAAQTLIDARGDGAVHTVAAAVLDERGGAHVGLNLFHFTGGPCAELVALAVARAAGARAPRMIVAVGDGGRGVLAPCGRDRQVLLDLYPRIVVLVPADTGLRAVGVRDLLPHGYRQAEQPVQRLRFRGTHLPAVRDGSKRVTMRFRDPVQVGPALLVFEGDEPVVLPGRIVSTVAKPVLAVTDAEAREDGFGDASAVLPGLRGFYPELRADDEIVLVRFEPDQADAHSDGRSDGYPAADSDA